MAYTRRQELICTEGQMNAKPNVILRDGEVIRIRMNNGSVYEKIGDGVTPIIDLPYNINSEIKTETLAELERRVGELGVVQTTGDSPTAVMSQKAVTAELNAIKSDFRDIEITEVITGYATNATGGLSPSANYDCAKCVAVKPLSNVTLKNIDLRYGRSIVLYDKNRIVVGVLYGTDSTLKEVTISIPDNCCYLSVSSPTGTLPIIEYADTFGKLLDNQLRAIDNDVMYRTRGFKNGAYEYFGEPINLKSYTFNAHNTNKAFSLNGSKSIQDCAIYGDTIFQFYSTAPTGIVAGNLVDYTTIATGTLAESLHANTVSFSDTFYDEADEYPLLYVNEYQTGNTPSGKCYVYRLAIQNSTITANLVQTITLGFISDAEYGSASNAIRKDCSFVVDTDRRKLIVYLEREREKTTRFYEFSLPEISNASVTLSQDAIERYFDVEYINFPQGACYVAGCVFVSSGASDGSDAQISVIDLRLGKTKTIIPLYRYNLITEPAFIDIYDGKIVFGTGIVFELDA